MNNLHMTNQSLFNQNNNVENAEILKNKYEIKKLQYVELGHFYNICKNNLDCAESNISTLSEILELETRSRIESEDKFHEKESNLKERVHSVLSQNALFLNKLQEVQKENSLLRVEMDEQFDLLSQLNHSKKLNSNMQAEINTLMDEKKKQSEDMKNVMSQNEKIIKDSTKFQHENKQLLNEREVLIEQLVNMQCEINSLNTTQQQELKEKDNLKRKYEKVNSENEEHVKKIQKTNSALEEKNITISTMEETLENNKKVIEKVYGLLGELNNSQDQSLKQEPK